MRQDMMAYARVCVALDMLRDTHVDEEDFERKNRAMDALMELEEALEKRAFPEGSQ